MAFAPAGLVGVLVMVVDIVLGEAPSAPPEHAARTEVTLSRVMAMTQWEYLTAPLLIHNTKQILDNFGADGWELVQIVNGPDGTSLVAYFKRPKS
ncbi:hypothetical protein GCM10028802_37780 [Terrabacter terrigena]